ncbi:MAG: formylglycine-generating enzyme family protein [Saprospiraceae bacterium]|nr:formylglycine-generating enzyme family protein [Saprospiraceae bacterium]
MLRPLRFQVLNQPFFLLPIEGGQFDMGMAKDDPDSWTMEQPVHSVQVPTFYLAQYPVTQALWTVVMGREGQEPFFTGDRRPMERISWDDAHVFLEKLRIAIQQPFRLPCEAEWEFAARGGAFRSDLKYAGSQRLKEVGWYYDNSHSETKPVGCKFPNELGLYDMSGNVREWCEDQWFNNYEDSPKDGSARIDRDEGSPRVHRGGDWLFYSRCCRSAYRDFDDPGYRRNFTGLRLALSLQ